MLSQPPHSSPLDFIAHRTPYRFHCSPLVSAPITSPPARAARAASDARDAPLRPVANVYG